jgi:Sigma-70, region 4
MGKVGTGAVVQQLQMLWDAGALGSVDDGALVELHEELERLPGRYRTAIVLCDLEGLSHEQASSRLGCPLRTLQTRLYRGRERLRLRLVRRGLTLATALVGTSHANGAFITVPPTWRIATVQAAVQVVGGPGAWARVGGVSAEVIRMARTGLNEMKMSMIKIGATVGLLVGAAGTVAWSQRSDGVGGKSKRPGTTQTSPFVNGSAKSGESEYHAKTPFEQTYVLSDGEDVKAFKSPARDVRVEHDRAASRAQGAVHSENENTDAYFRWRDGARKWFSTVGGGKGIELRAALLQILGMHEQEAEGDIELLRTSLRADFIIRDGVSTEKLVPQLATILRKDFGLPIKLALRTESRKVIVVRGRYQFKPDIARDRVVHGPSKVDRIEVYARVISGTGDRTRRLFATGQDLATFLSDLAKHAGRRFINEVEAPPEGFFEWHISDYTYPVASSEEDLDLTLEHLAAQTGFTFKKEVRKVRVLRVERDQ